MNTRSASARSLGTVVRVRGRSLPLAVANPLPTAELLSITANPAAPFTNRATNAANPVGSVVSGVSSFARVARGRTVERGGPSSKALRFVPVFPRRRNRLSGFMNFCRPHLAAGKPSFFRIPFVDHCSEAANSITNWLGLAPVLSSVPVLHASQESMEKAAWRPEKFRIASRKSQ